MKNEAEENNAFDMKAVWTKSRVGSPGSTVVRALVNVRVESQPREIVAMGTFASEVYTK